MFSADSEGRDQSENFMICVLNRCHGYDSHVLTS